MSDDVKITVHSEGVTMKGPARPSRVALVIWCLAIVAGITVCAVAAAGAATPPSTFSFGVFGQQGPVTPNNPTPTEVDGIPGTVVQTVATNSTTYDRLSDGTVWAFGAGNLGELGDGKTVNSPTTPVQVKFPPGVTITALADPMPYATAIAIDGETNTAYGWGADTGDQLCTGTSTQVNKPVPVPLADVTLASGGGQHATYDTGGILRDCGNAHYGELGNGGHGNADKGPVTVQGLPQATWVQLVSGYATTGALTSDGRYYDWGENPDGQLGQGALSPFIATAQQVDLPEAVTQAEMGGNTATDGHTFVRLADGTWDEWGANDYGQLCDGTVNIGEPTPKPLNIGFTPDSAAAGGTTSYFITGGVATSCGSDRNGEVGSGIVTNVPYTSPVPVQLPVGMTAVAVDSTSHNVGLLAVPQG